MEIEINENAKGELNSLSLHDITPTETMAIRKALRECKETIGLSNKLESELLGNVTPIQIVPWDTVILDSPHGFIKVVATQKDTTAYIFEDPDGKVCSFTLRVEKGMKTTLI